MKDVRYLARSPICRRGYGANGMRVAGLSANGRLHHIDEKQQLPRDLQQAKMYKHSYTIQMTVVSGR